MISKISSWALIKLNVNIKKLAFSWKECSPSLIVKCYFFYEMMPHSHVWKGSQISLDTTTFLSYSILSFFSSSRSICYVQILLDVWPSGGACLTFSGTAQLHWPFISLLLSMSDIISTRSDNLKFLNFWEFHMCILYLHHF